MTSDEIKKYKQADIVLTEITKGVFKVVNSKIYGLKDDTYLDSIQTVQLLNRSKVIIVTLDSNILHQNF